MKTAGKDLRPRAEALLKKKAPRTAKGVEETERLLHELDVHQLELEMQNEELAENNRRLDIIASFSSSWESWVGKDGRPAWISLSVAAVTGYTVEECMAMPDYPFAIVHAEDRERLRKALQSPAGTAADANAEFRFVSKAGETRWGLISWRPVDDDASGYRSSVVDISLRKIAEDELVVSERRAVIGLMAAGVAHEFNNVLGIISNCVQVQRLHQSRPEEVERYFDVILEQVRRGAAVVKNLGNMGRIPVGVGRKIRVSLLIEDLLLVEKKSLALENIKIVRDFDAAVMVKIVSASLEQALLNLLINARHALLPKGGGTIRLETRRVEGWAEIRITDDGIGMDEETRRKAPVPFFTTKGAYAKNMLGIPGTGLGLHIVQSMLEQYGGSLKFTSVKGEGTTVIVRLPACEDTSGDGEKNGGVPLAGEYLTLFEDSLRPEVAARSVLIVDDEELIDRYVCEFLEDLGFRVTYTSDSREAARMIERNVKFDVYILDENMPDVRGSELARRIRKTDDTAILVFMTGQLHIVELDRLLAPLDVRAILRKPFDLIELLRAVKTEPVPGKVL